MKPNVRRTKFTGDIKQCDFELISKYPTVREVKQWGISMDKKGELVDYSIYQMVLKYVKKYFEFDVPDGYIEDYRLSQDGFFTIDVITPERVALVYMALMRKESYENMRHFLYDVSVPNNGTYGILPIYAKDCQNNPRYMSAGCLAFGCTMISARADVLRDFDDLRHAAWSQEYCIELGVKAFALKVASVIRGKRSNLLDAAVVAYHAWKSEYSKDESSAWRDEYYTDIKALYLKHAPIKEGEKVYKELRRGDRGNEVVRLQIALGGLDTDGIFGELTENELMSFQKRCGLAPTGKLDSFTYSILYDMPVQPRKIKIAIDDGHGMDITGGKWSPPLIEDLYINGKLVRKKGERIKENEFNDAVCDLLEESLKRCGFEVFRSAPEDKDISLPERKKRIREAGCDLSISIHYNASNSKNKFDSGNGLSGKVDDDTPTQFAIDLVQLILENISLETGQKIRGIDKANLAMTNDDAMRTIAILIECGFMTNLIEMMYMLDTKYHNIIAEAITKAVCEAYNIKYVELGDKEKLYTADEVKSILEEALDYALNKIA